LNGAAGASTFPGTFRSTAFAFLNSMATAIVLGVGTVVSYLVWLTCSGRGRSPR
jgi:hypothetical protein